MTIKHMRYCVLIVETDEVLECNNLQELYNAIRQHFRCKKYGNERITAKFYKDLDWYKHGFDHSHPFYIMTNYEY